MPGFLKLLWFVHYVCLSPRALITSGVIWCDCVLCQTTVVWEIFVRDNLVVKFIRCVIFSWVSYTHENILPSNFVRTERSYLRYTFLTTYAAVTD